MKGKMVVLTNISKSKINNNIRYRKLLFESYTKELLSQQKFIAKKYEDNYSTCYISSKDPIDMTIVPDDIVIEIVTYLPSLHVLFEITKEKEN